MFTNRKITTYILPCLLILFTAYVFFIPSDLFGDYTFLVIFSFVTLLFASLLQMKVQKKKWIHLLNQAEENETKFATLFNHASDLAVLFEITPQGVPGNFLEVNRMCIEKLGYTQEEFRNLSPRDISPTERVSKIPSIMEMLENKGTFTFEGGYLTKNKELIPLEFNANLLHIHGKRVIFSIGRDISERKKLEAKIQFMAFHDALTGLPNRYLMNQYIDKLVSGCHLSQNNKFSLMFLDLDHFKNINDTLGHHMGDLLLKQVTERLGKCVRNKDVVARQGGDEFIILLPETPERIQTEKIAQRILDVFSIPFVLGNKKIRVSTSIGISVFSEDGNDSGTLIRHADHAMYKAKKKGKNNYQFFSYEESIFRKTIG